MNISENKRVVALSAVFALAFGGVMFYGYGKSQEDAENKAKIAEINDRFAGYDGQELAPTKQNLKELKASEYRRLSETSISRMTRWSQAFSTSHSSSTKR